MEQLRKQQVETEKSHLRQLDAQKKAMEESIDQANKRCADRKGSNAEADVDRMEQVLIEMHKRMDQLKQERSDSDFEAK